MDWMSVNNLKLNRNKTEVPLFSSKLDSGTEMQPVLDGVALPLTGPIDSLECSLVLIDPGLPSAVVMRSAFALLHLVTRLMS